MKKFFTLLTFWSLIFLPGMLYAQQDYTIRTHAGNFIPVDNVRTLTKSSPVFSRSAFDNMHYMVIQFNSLPSDAIKAQMKAAGIILVDYIPNLAFTAAVKGSINMEVFKSFPLRSAFQFTPEQKTIPDLLSRQFPSHAVSVPGFVDVTVITYEKLSAAKVTGPINELGASILQDMPMFRQFTLRVPAARVNDLVEMNFIQWVEFIEPPAQTENLPGRTLHRVNVLNNPAGRNLQGDGIAVGIWDEGAIVQHLDFSPTGRVTQVQVVGVSQHSSHCAGTILGRGVINPIARGMAPNATLFSWDFNGNIQTEMASGIPTNSLVVSSHSYGSGTPNCNPTGAGISYSATSAATDQNLNTFPSHIHCHSAGNSQSVCSGGWYTITSSGKPAKNNIVVADITTSETLSGSSSCGPVADGRIKPEISAMGTNVFSTSTPTNGYATLSGTSMATPGVSGTCALLVQRYKQLNSNNLSPSSLIKNVLLNAAKDLGNAGPDYRFGYGRVNALASVRILKNNRYVINSISTGGSIDVPVTVPAGTARIKVMLNWNDPAAQPIHPHR